MCFTKIVFLCNFFFSELMVVYLYKCTKINSTVVVSKFWLVMNSVHHHIHAVYDVSISCTHFFAHFS